MTDTQAIKSKEEAKNVWDTLKKHYEQLIESQNLAKQSNSQNKSQIRRRSFFSKDDEQVLAKWNTDEREKAYQLAEKNYEKTVSDTRKIWQRFASDITKVEVNPSGFHHSLELNLMLNKKKLKKSIKTERLASLLQEIDKEPYNGKLFQKDDAPFLLMGLAAKGAITPTQFESFLAIGHDRRAGDFLGFKVHDILDKDESADDKFTDDAENILLPSINKRSWFHKLSEAQKKSFLYLVASLPKSEQKFFLVSYSHLLNQSPTSAHLLKYFSDIGIILIHTSSDKKKWIIPLTKGVQTALSLVYFGYDNFVRTSSAFGIFPMGKIEEGARIYVRYSFLRFLGVDQPKILHGTKNVPDFIARAHDEYHAAVMASIGPYFLQTLLYFVDVVRDASHLLISREMWEWIDAEYTYFLLQKTYNKIKPDDPDFTQKWCEFIIRKSLTKPENPFQYGNFLSIQGERGKVTITPVGILIILDMIKNPHQWQKLHIKLDKLKGDLDYFYKTIQLLHQKYLEKDPVMIQVLKIQIYFYLYPKKNQKINYEEFESICKVIDDNHDIKKQLHFSKLKKPPDVNISYDEYISPKDTETVPNRVFLFMGETPINNNTIKDVIENLSLLPKPKIGM